MATRKPYELSNIVREYVLALRIHTRQNKPEKAKPDNIMKFGKKPVKKKRRKKRKNVFGGEDMRASLDAGARTVSDEELAERKQLAKQAMEQASELASEDVKYCCGLIRLASNEYECYCHRNELYMEINVYGRTRGGQLAT